MNTLLGGGIIATALIAGWDKVKQVVWYFLSFFVCRVELSGVFSRFGATYVWNALKYKKSLSPIYCQVICGSGKEQKMFLREVGFKNYRFIKIGKMPVMVRVDEELGAFFIGLKPFINHEKIIKEVFGYYRKKYIDSNDKSLKISKFSTQFIRGSLNKKENTSNGRDAEESPRMVSETNIDFYFNEAEKFDIGRRINYTAEEYRQLVTFTKEDVKLIDNLYLTPAMKSLKNKLSRWFHHKDWFVDRSIQWKRGVLIHGEPGTGKTSFIAALAENFNVPLFVFDLSTFTNEDLHREWHKLKSSTPCFVVFEDFDSVFNGRTNVYTQNAMANKPLSFDCVLNTLDGAIKFDGIVTFITTNDISKIDSALGGGGNTRPGRIDYVYEMNGIDENGRRFITEKIFSGMDNEEELIEKAMQSDCITPAQFKEYCINAALETYNEEE